MAVEQPIITAGPLVLSQLDHRLELNLADRLAGQQGTVVSFPASTLDGTLLPEVSLDGGTNWVGSQFASPVSGTVSLSYGGDGANAADSFIILAPGPATHARVRVSAWNAGEITVTLRSVPTLPNFLFGTDGSNLRAPLVTNTTPDTCSFALVTRSVGGSGGGTSLTDDSAFTVGTSEVTPSGFVFQSTPDTVNDNDVGAARMTAQRAVYVSHETPAGQSMVDDTNDALNVTLVTTATIGGQSATSTTIPITACDEQFNVAFTAIQTGQLVCGLSGKRIRICSMFALFDATTNLTFVRGTGTCCATFQATIMGPVRLSSTAGLGFTYGNGVGVVLDGVASTCSICVTSSAVANGTVSGRYAIY